MAQTQIETDSMGAIEVPADRYWGAQTQRSLEHFKIGGERFPREMIRALGLVKKAGALVNHELGLLARDEARGHRPAADEVIAGTLDEHFPLRDLADRQRHPDQHERQRGHRQPRDRDPRRADGLEEAGPSQRPRQPLAVLQRRLSDGDARGGGGADRGHGCFRRWTRCATSLDEKARAFADIVKIGRTHLQDATPLTLGQEFSGYVGQLDHALAAIRRRAARALRAGRSAARPSAPGSTRPRTSASASPRALAALTGLPFTSAPNKFEALGVPRGGGGGQRRAQDARRARSRRSPTTSAGSRSGPAPGSASCACPRTSPAAASCPARSTRRSARR